MDIKVKNIAKSFGENKALKDISFSVKSGHALGLLGRNGAGKTTTIRIIMDVFKPDSGYVLLDDEPINKKTVKFGYMPEERGLYPKETIKTQLLYICELNGISRKDGLVSIKKWLKRLDMTQHLNDKLNTLSKGNQQKIQLISVLMYDANIIILDEPFSGLDPVNALALKEIVKDLIAENKLVIFSSHQMNYIEEFCNDIVIIDKGKIVLSGNLIELKNQYPKTHINITGNDVAAIKSTIALDIPHLVDNVSLENDNLDVYLKIESDRDIILDIIAKNSYDIDSFSVVKPSLEQMFIQITGGDS